MDVTGVPTNPMYERLMRVITNEEDRRMLNNLHDEHKNSEQAVIDAKQTEDTSKADLSKLRGQAQLVFHAYNRIIWALAKKYPLAEPKRSRDEIDITPPRLGSVPIIVANSVNISLRGLLAAPRYGMTGTVMQERDIQAMDRKLTRYSRALRNADPLYREFCSLTLDAKVRDYWHLIQRYEDDFAIVLDGDRDHFNRDGEFLGIVGPNEIKKAKGRTNVSIREIYRPAHKVLCAEKGIDAEGVVDLLDEKGEEFLPIMDGNRVVGVTSKRSAGFQLRFAPHLDNQRGGLAYLVGLRHDEKNIELIRTWIEKKMVGKGFKVDRAHLDRGTDPFIFISEIRKLIDELDPTLELHAGNVATGDGALRAADAGATGIWVGVGPSPVCITREVTNYGVPQVAAVESVREKLENHDFLKTVLIGADGGVLDTSGHMNAVKRAGANFAIGSTNYSKTRESSPEIEHFKNRDKSKWKIWVSGNASNLVQFDAPPRVGETKVEKYRRVRGPRREGDTRIVSMHPRFENYREYTEDATDGETSGTSFAGADNTAEYHEYGQSVEQTSAGFQEGRSRLDGAQPEF